MFAKRLETNYEADCIELIAQYRGEHDFRMKFSKQITENYENIHDGLDLMTENKIKEIENKFVADKLRLECDSFIKQENYRETADGFKNNLSEQMEHILEAMKRNYGLEAIQEKYKMLVKDDNIAGEEILKLETDIELKHSVIVKLEKEIHDVEDKTSRTLSALDREKQQLYDCLGKLKNEMKLAEQEHDKRVRCLVVTAHQASKVSEYHKCLDIGLIYFKFLIKIGKLLNERSQYGEHILALFNACRSYRTEAEKIKAPEGLATLEPDMEVRFLHIN